MTLVGTVGCGKGTVTPDSIPDSFTFTAQSGVSRNTAITSNDITVSGINATTTISISGADGTYSINGEDFTDSDGTVEEGDTIHVKLKSSEEYNTAVSVTLNIGGVMADFNVTTESGPTSIDTTPDVFAFTAQTGVTRGAVITSNEITVNGINAATVVSISGADGTYSINGEAYSNETGFVNDGDTVSIRLTSSADYNKSVSSVLNIGGVTNSFNVSTESGGVSTDTLPDTFTLSEQINVDASSVVTSNDITVSGINAPTEISISGADGTYSINGGDYSNETGFVNNGDTVIVRLTASSGFNATVSASLTIGGVASSFNVTTTSPDTTPDSFTFTAQTGAPLDSVITSNEITVTGINASTAISITGGTYSINGGLYTSLSGSVINGNTVSVRLKSSTSYSTQVVATLTIGSMTGDFNVMTLSDTTPDAFAFAGQTGIERGAIITSSQIIVSGINAPAVISISGAGGTYSINGGDYSDLSGTVKNGDTVTVQLKSSLVFNTTVSTSLTIGGVMGSFNLTTESADTTPNPFTFAAQTGVPLSSVITSNEITVAGINTPAVISISGADGTYSVNGGEYTNLSGKVNNGDTVTVRLTALSDFNTTESTSLTIGSVMGSFSLTTELEDVTPDPFTFAPGTNADINVVRTSNQITITGINAPTSISISGADGTYSINNGSYTNSLGTVNNGDTVKVRLTTSAICSTSVSTSLNIGGVAGTYTVTTESADTTPYSFSFTTQTGVSVVSEITSNQIKIYGINSPSPISISGADGTYSINGGNFTSLPGTVKLQDTISVKLISSESHNATVTASLNIGGVTGTFSVTTMPGCDSISTGGLHTAAIKAEGSLFTWGINTYGQLGDETKVDKYVPTQIGNEIIWESISLSGAHTLAIKTDGSLYAWGWNEFGQLGIGGIDSSRFRIIPVRVGIDNNWASVSAGNSHTAAIKTDGSLYAWGNNYEGAFGDGTAMNGSFVPVHIGNENNWSSVSAGQSYTVAIKTDGSLYVWGDNTFGQLGDGTKVDKLVPTRIGIENNWDSVVASHTYTVAIKTNGALYAWGCNDKGQFGDGTIVDKYVPTRIGTANDWASVTVGEEHTVAIKTDGSLYAWGNNEHGELGDGTKVNKHIPTRIGSDTNWASVSAGSISTVALTKDGTIFGWGVNDFGQLGDGTTVDKLVPTIMW